MYKTLTKNNIKQMLVEEVGLANAQAQQLLNETIKQLSESIINEDSLKLSSFGSFVVLNKEKRPGRNFKTGEKILIQQRKAVSFRASNYLKRKIDKKI